jgi:hypothetical protein
MVLIGFTFGRVLPYDAPFLPFSKVSMSSLSIYLNSLVHDRILNEVLRQQSYFCYLSLLQ